MTNSTEGIIFLLSTLICIQLTGQVSSHHPNRLVITFKANVSEADIDDLQRAYTAIEVSQFAETDIRVWEIPSFPVHFKYRSHDQTLLNINTVNQSAIQQAEVEGVDFDYLMELYNNSSDGSSQNSGASFDCDRKYFIKNVSGNSTTRLSIIDTGHSPNASDQDTYFYFDLGGSNGYNYVENNTDYNDDHGHGTHIASIVNHVSHSASEVEPHSSYTKYTMQKSFNQNGNAYLSDVLDAVDESIAKNVNILNFSFSYRAYEPDRRNKTPMQKAIERAEAANMLIVTAAGNDFGVDNDQDSIKNYPASFDYPNILSVASINCSGRLSNFSNYGFLTIDVTAPGEYIEGASPNDEVVRFSGTSQSTAIVSGIANMLASHLINFDYKKIKCAILTGAEIIPELEGKILTSGVVNAKNALNILNDCDQEVQPVDGLIPFARSVKNMGTAIKVYPNPAKEFIRIESTLSKSEDFEYSIIDLSGKEIINGSSFGHKGQASFDVNIPQSIKNGFYFFNYKTSSLKGLQKIVILR